MGNVWTHEQDIHRKQAEQAEQEKHECVARVLDMIEGTRMPDAIDTAFREWAAKEQGYLKFGPREGVSRI